MATTYNESVSSYLHQDHKETTALFYGGAVAGMVAGIIMAMVSMVTNYFTGAGFFLSVKLIAATFLGVDSIIGGAFAIMLGMILHLVTSAMWGVVFAFITAKVKSLVGLFASAILFSVFVWAAMTFVSLPILNEVMSERVDMIPVQWFINHLIFGMGLLLAPYFEYKNANTKV
jgi:hypothetical protein